ncbi:succinate dehydrogenase assembly factor 2 [Inquilinus sp. CAU 1745]|uniref:succinate dehydrogenase assembly factor 2 n=1 Tax=Inquilinus sp. CAU 1745 TaxID=3140369 RepID=UPI00325A46AE
MPDASVSADIDRRRRQIRFRCWHRGTREADLLLGSFADARIDGFDARQLSLFEALLEHSDPDIYNWFSGREPLPPALDTEIARLLMAHKVPSPARP